MQILFEAFYFTDEYWKLIDSGIKSVEDDYNYETDCELRKVLINVSKTTIVNGIENGKYTLVNDGNTSRTLNIPFTDYLKLVPHHSAKTIKQRWAN